MTSAEFLTACRSLLVALIVLWPVAEVALIVRRRVLDSAVLDGRWTRAGAVLAVAVGTLGLAVWLGSLGLAPLPGGETVWLPLGLLLMVGGLLVRWRAVVTLGRYFKPTVTIHDDHRLVRTGVYRIVRHPSYTGLFFGYLGLGIALGSWLSVALAVVPNSIILWLRIRVEERALLERFGAEYAEYRATTRALVPWLF